MTKNNINEGENRDGDNSSSSNESGSPMRRKRLRVGDLRKQTYDIPTSDRSRNPYKTDTEQRDDRPTLDYNRGGGDDSERRSYSRPSRPTYDNQGKSDYNRREGYTNQNSQGRDSRGNYSNDNRNDRDGDNRRSGGFSNNRGGNYSNDKRGSYDNRNKVDGKPSQGGKRLSKPVKYKENIDPSTPIRLNKYLANAGVCSRREADAFITSGLVKVNGEVVKELGSKVLRSDMVMFNDKPIRLESKVYVLLNKPRNCVTTSDDPQNRTTVMDMVKGACPERIYPVGRLDRNTTGVLLLTNDGDLASKLMHPKYAKKKIYQVTLDRDVSIDDMQKIADGIELDDGEIHADSIAYNSEDELNVIGIEIHSGRNRIVRRIFEKLNYQVVRLDRVYFAGLTKKNVSRGRWRYLSETEVNMLRMGAFE